MIRNGEQDPAWTVEHLKEVDDKQHEPDSKKENR